MASTLGMFRAFLGGGAPSFGRIKFYKRTQTWLVASQVAGISVVPRFVVQSG